MFPHIFSKAPTAHFFVDPLWWLAGGLNWRWNPSRIPVHRSPFLTRFSSNRHGGGSTLPQRSRRRGGRGRETVMSPPRLTKPAGASTNVVVWAPGWTIANFPQSREAPQRTKRIKNLRQVSKSIPSRLEWCQSAELPIEVRAQSHHPLDTMR